MIFHCHGVSEWVIYFLPHRIMYREYSLAWQMHHKDLRSLPNQLSLISFWQFPANIKGVKIRDLPGPEIKQYSYRGSSTSKLCFCHRELYNRAERDRGTEEREARLGTESSCDVVCAR